MWDFPSYGKEIAGLENVEYHLFSSVGSYNSAKAPQNVTVEGLILDFEQGGLNENETQYHRVEGDVFNFSLNTTFIGELHTLSVIAEAGGVFSKNVEATKVRASSLDPIVKEGRLARQRDPRVYRSDERQSETRTRQWPPPGWAQHFQYMPKPSLEGN